MGYGAYVEELKAEPLFRGLDLVVLQSTESTMSSARGFAVALAERGLPPGRLLIAAWGQTGGRGRRGRVWRSRPGAAVAASLTVPVEQASALDALPLRVAVALHRRLSEVAGEPCGIKWPNDILLDGRKLVGILIELVRHSSEAATAIVGFGVNRQAPDDVEGAVGLEEARQPPPSLARLTALLAEAVVGELDLDRPAVEIVDAYRAASVHRQGEAMRWKTAEGIVEGVFKGFDEKGFLRVMRGGSEERLAAAELIEG